MPKWSDSIFGAPSMRRGRKKFLSHDRLEPERARVPKRFAEGFVTRLVGFCAAWVPDPNLGTSGRDQGFEQPEAHTAIGNDHPRGAAAPQKIADYQSSDQDHVGTLGL